MTVWCLETARCATCLACSEAWVWAAASLPRRVAFVLRRWAISTVFCCSAQATAALSSVREESVSARMTSRRSCNSPSRTARSWCTAVNQASAAPSSAARMPASRVTRIVPSLLRRRLSAASAESEGRWASKTTGVRRSDTAGRWWAVSAAPSDAWRSVEQLASPGDCAPRRSTELLHRRTQSADDASCLLRWAAGSRRCAIAARRNNWF